MHGSGLIKACTCLKVIYCDLVYVFTICVASCVSSWTECGFVYSVTANLMTKGKLLNYFYYLKFARFLCTEKKSKNSQIIIH